MTGRTPVVSPTQLGVGLVGATVTPRLFGTRLWGYALKVSCYSIVSSQLLKVECTDCLTYVFSPECEDVDGCGGKSDRTALIAGT